MGDIAIAPELFRVDIAMIKIQTEICLLIYYHGDKIKDVRSLIESVLQSPDRFAEIESVPDTSASVPGEPPRDDGDASESAVWDLTEQTRNPL